MINKRYYLSKKILLFFLICIFSNSLYAKEPKYYIQMGDTVHITAIAFFEKNENSFQNRKYRECYDIYISQYTKKPTSRYKLSCRKKKYIITQKPVLLDKEWYQVILKEINNNNHQEYSFSKVKLELVKEEKKKKAREEKHYEKIKQSNPPYTKKIKEGDSVCIYDIGYDRLQAALYDKCVYTGIEDNMTFVELKSPCDQKFKVLSIAPAKKAKDNNKYWYQAELISGTERLKFTYVRLIPAVKKYYFLGIKMQKDIKCFNKYSNRKRKKSLFKKIFDKIKKH